MKRKFGGGGGDPALLKQWQCHRVLSESMWAYPQHQPKEQARPEHTLSHASKVATPSSER
jgi:hypothetical protein